MNVYMAQFTLPHILGNDIASRIPAHRTRVDELIQEGVILAYAVSQDRTAGWITLCGESVHDVEEVLQTLPIYRYLEFQIHELMVYDARNLRFPALRMN